MYATLAAIVKSLFPLIEPIAKKVAAILVADLIAAAKAQTLPAKYSFLTPAITAAEDELLKLFADVA